MSTTRTVIGLLSGVDRGRHARRRRVLVVALALVAALAALGGMSAFADTSNYFSYGGSFGNVSVGATCDHVNHRGTVGLTAQHPDAAKNGMYFYTQVFVKNHNATWSNALLLDQRQSYVNGWTTQPISIWGGTMTINSTKTIVNGLTFTGANWNYYDIGVRYWTALPGGQWSASTWFTANDFFEVTGSYGYGTETSTCML